MDIELQHYLQHGLTDEHEHLLHRPRIPFRLREHFALVAAEIAGLPPLPARAASRSEYDDAQPQAESDEDEPIFEPGGRKPALYHQLFNKQLADWIADLTPEHAEQAQAPEYQAALEDYFFDKLWGPMR